MRVLLYVAVMASSLIAQTVDLPTPEQPDRGDRLWKISVGALAVTSALDAHSSWGKCCESNVLLRSDDRRFGTRAAVIKAIASGSQVSIQAFAARRSKKMRTLFTVINFGTSVGMTAIAIRNYRWQSPGGPVY